MSKLSPSVGPLDHSHGAIDAPVTLVEYGDFECPYCGAMHGVITAVQHVMGEKLRFVFRHFPLTEMHAHALHAAEFSEAAAALGKFWDAHNMLYENQRSLGDQNIAQYAAELGLPPHSLTAAFSGRYDERIQSDFASGIRSGVQGTPTLFINGHLYGGEHNAQSLLEALRDAAKR
ncbi:DsbA family protein [Paraburkholderia sp. CNPSo 3274]|uniref:DsbA family protein n=1 Tax=Paraburkholderia sp. CNPSo 3274 TaxID=2940932 RepID=UPI0020B86F24|nr:DsbA family protein [Paraburkholderia sp. CNPSo 3274]MCP3709313.1 DsbA family protein [Paraburkholderia sp. CNPSo 3274]